MFAVLKGIIIICLRSVCDLYAMFIKADIKVYARDLIPRALANSNFLNGKWVVCQLSALISPYAYFSYDISYIHKTV